MFRLYDSSNSDRIEDLHERFGDLSCQLLLNLQPSRKDIDDAGDLG